MNAQDVGRPAASGGLPSRGQADGPLAGLFFTGTDTGVGKTAVTAAVARALRRQGRDVGVCKPVATGATWDGTAWLAEDTRVLAEAVGISAGLERVTPWVFPEPAAPPVAAHCHGVNLTLEGLAGAVLAWRQWSQAVLVEGVGGLLCPLTERETVADLAGMLQLPLVVVARRSLGTLNHTLLTLEVARHRGLSVAGVVVNETVPPAGLADRTNVAELERRLGVPLLAVVSHQPGTRAVELPAPAEVDWWRLCLSSQPTNCS